MATTNQITARREQHMATIEQSLRVALDALKTLPDEQRIPAHKALLDVWRKNIAVADLVSQAERHMAESDATIMAATEAIRQVTGQRDQALNELDSITQALAEAFGEDDPFVANARASIDQLRRGE